MSGELEDVLVSMSFEHLLTASWLWYQSLLQACWGYSSRLPSHRGVPLPVTFSISTRQVCAGFLGEEPCSEHLKLVQVAPHQWVLHSWPELLLTWTLAPEGKIVYSGSLWKSTSGYEWSCLRCSFVLGLVWLLLELHGSNLGWHCKGGLWFWLNNTVVQAGQIPYNLKQMPFILTNTFPFETVSPP